MSACAAAAPSSSVAAGAPGPGSEELTDLLLTFLEVAVHAILFARGVYPEAIFERRKQYGMATWMSRHPRLNDCIHEALYHMKAPIMRGAVDAVVVLLQDAMTGAPLEQYVVALSVGEERWPATYSDLDTMFQSALLRIALLSETTLPPLPVPAPPGDAEESLPTGTTFTLLLRTHEVLEGPNDAADHAAAGGSAGLPFTRGVLGTASGAATAAAARITDDGGYWARVDPGDVEADLPADAAAEASTAVGRTDAPRFVARPVKSIRAGGLAVELSVVHRNVRASF